jgi:hypothetical protein
MCDHMCAIFWPFLAILYIYIINKNRLGLQYGVGLVVHILRKPHIFFSFIHFDFISLRFYSSLIDRLIIEDAIFLGGFWDQPRKKFDFSVV